MKAFIGAVMVLLCIQAIDAIFSEGNCRRELAASRREVKIWFGKFEIEHNVAHDDLIAIQENCTILTAALQKFKETPPTECQIAEFLTQFHPARIAALQAITHLRFYCDVLLDMAAEYRCGKSAALCIENFSGSECKVNANKVNCELIDFFIKLEVYGAEAKGFLDGLLESCDQLGKLARDFDCANKPNCSCGDGHADYDVQEAIAEFLGVFIPVHEIAHDQLSGVTAICNALTGAIQYFKNK